MLVLLPPSETKSTKSRGKALGLESLSFGELTAARTQVAEALMRVSAQDDAPEQLGVSANLGVEIARNLRIFTAPALSAAQMYTGVLYDALDAGSLSGGDKTRANRRIVISSGLYGAVRLNDKVAPYRLSMGVNLPDVGPVAGFWRDHLEAPMSETAGDGLIIDCRSSTYAASWTPGGAQAEKWVHIRVPGATHVAKHTRGLVARYLVTTAAKPVSPSGLEKHVSKAFTTSLSEPVRPGKPWILDVSAP